MNLMQVVYGKPASLAPTSGSETEDMDEDEDSEDDQFMRPKQDGNKVIEVIYHYCSCWKFKYIPSKHISCS